MICFDFALYSTGATGKNIAVRKGEKNEYEGTQVPPKFSTHSMPEIK